MIIGLRRQEHLKIFYIPDELSEHTLMFELKLELPSLGSYFVLIMVDEAWPSPCLCILYCN